MNNKKVQAEIGLCQIENVHDSKEALKEFELLCQNYKDKWADTTFDYFMSCKQIIEKDLKVLDIIKRHPFILERLFDEGGMHDDYNHDYWWGVVTVKEVEMVKEWLKK